MNQMFNQCSNRRDGLRLENNNYQSRDIRLVNDPTKNHFLTGPYQPQGDVLGITTDSILIDRFIIKNYLGSGLFGTVYMAEDTLSSTLVALKAVEIGPCSNEVAGMQLKREMKILNRISNHKHVIRTYDLHFVPWGGTGLLVLSMEYANGGTFRKWLIEHSDDLETRRTVGLDCFKQACRGLDTIHDADVTHLDLKPENLLFVDDILKVSDFGTAQCAQLLMQSSNYYRDLPPFDYGTPLYMSPEHFLAAHPDDLSHKADIYSLGIILYELFHPKCRPPFWGSYERLNNIHRNVPAPQLPETDENMVRIVARCLEKNPDDRYQSVLDLLYDLENRCCSNMEALPSEDAGTYNTRPNELERTWETASLCFSEDDFTEATRLTEKILSVDPEHTQARQLNEELQSRFDRAQLFYQEISKNLEAGDLSELIDLLQEAVSIYPEHPEGHLVQSKLAAKAKRYRDVMKQGVQVLQEEQWEPALDFFKKAITLHSGALWLNPIIQSLTELKDMRRNMNQALDQENFDKTLLYARSIDLKAEKMKNRIPALRGEMEEI